MKKIFFESIKYIVFAIIMIMALSLNDCKAYAADANVTVSSGNVEEGKELSVTVNISSAQKMAAYNILLTYDANLLEYVSGADGGGNGAVKLLNELFEDTSVTRTLVFKAKKAGSVDVKVDTTASSIIDMNIEDCQLVVANGVVTINPKVTSSANNNLASLEVVGVREDGSTQAYNITQRETNVVGFDKNQTKYMAYVANDIVKFAVTAVTEDNTATVSVTGVDLAEGGANVTTITVTAQNGEVRTYTINTYRVPSEEESETPAESETPVEPETPGEDESETTAPTLVDKEVTIGNDIYIITNIAEDMDIPEGFSRIDYTYDGQVYVAAKGEAKKLIIMQLVKKGTEEKGLYVYDDTQKIFYKFVNIQIINKMYTVIEKPENVRISEDFEPTLVNIEGEMLSVWASKTEDGIYLFYGMNWNGEEGLYLYDSKEKTAMRYLAITSSQVSNTVTPEPDNNANTTANNSNIPGNSDGSMEKIIIFAESGIILVLIIVIIILIIRFKNTDLDEEDEEDEYEDEDDGEDEKEDNIEEEKDEESILANAINYLMEKEEAVKDIDQEEYDMVTEPVTIEEPKEEPIEEIVEETEDDTMEEVTEELTKEPEEEVTEELTKEPEEEVTEELTKELEEEVTEELTKEPEEEVTEELTKEPEEEVTGKMTEKPSIEEMLSDASTSLNDEELDLVLDKLLGEE